MNKDEKYYTEQRKKWLVNHGFDPESETTYIVIGETYSIKDALKALGMKYDNILGWHSHSFFEEYADRMVAININDIAEATAYETYNFKTIAKEFIGSFNNAGTPVVRSQGWVAAPGDYIKDLTVTLVKKVAFNGKFGLTNLLSFATENSELINWFTTTIPIYQTGDKINIVSAFVKKNDEYKGDLITVITRPKLKKVEEESAFDN